MAQFRSLIDAALRPVPSKAGQWPMFRNPMEHPVRFIITILLTIIGVIEWAIAPPVSVAGTVCAVISLVALLLAGIFPVPCNLIVIMNFVSTGLFFSVEGPSQLLAVAYAICAITYDTDVWLGVVLCAPVIAAMIMHDRHHPAFHWLASSMQKPIVILLFITALIFSVIARQNSLYTEVQQKADQAADLQRRVEVAQMVHDSVTGDLANIARIAQRQMRLQDNNADQRKAWSQVNDRVSGVLSNVYAVIRQLDDSSGSSVAIQTDEDVRRFSEVIYENAEAWESKLTEAGLNGEFQLVDHVHAPLNYGGKQIVEQRKCFLNIMNEMFANIMKHGVPGEQAWQIVVTISAEQLELVSVNRMFTENMKDEQGNVVSEPVLPGGGHGLKLHRERVESLGGVMIATTEDGQWMMYVRIPRPAVEYHQG